METRDIIEGAGAFIAFLAVGATWFQARAANNQAKETLKEAQETRKDAREAQREIQELVSKRELQAWLRDTRFKEFYSLSTAMQSLYTATSGDDDDIPIIGRVNDELLLSLTRLKLITDDKELLTHVATFMDNLNLFIDKYSEIGGDQGFKHAPKETKEILARTMVKLKTSVLETADIMRRILTTTD